MTTGILARISWIASYSFFVSLNSLIFHISKVFGTIQINVATNVAMHVTMENMPFYWILMNLCNDQ